VVGKLAIVAGAGDLVPEVVLAARLRGYEPLVLSLVERDLPGVELYHFEPERVDLVLGVIRTSGARHIALAGYAPKATLEALAAFAAAAGQGAPAGMADLATRLSGLVQRLTGAEFIGLDSLAPGLVAPAGLIAGPPPSPDTTEAARAAIAQAREFGRRDLGQAVVLLPDGSVFTEDEAGTDGLLIRVAATGLVGGILAKAAKPQQPLFADLPVIGPVTVDNAARAGIVLIAVEAGRTLLVQRAALETAARATGISLFGVDG